MCRIKPRDPAELLRQVRRQSFPDFLERAWPHITGGSLMDPNWHIDAIAHCLDQVESGDIKRLMVNLPPRNGKSNTVTVVWVAYMLGLDPTRNFVSVSYADESLSATMARHCISIIQSDWYKEIFPGTRISPMRSAASDFQTTAGGGRLSTSVGGTLTGRGGDIIILDDVIKPEEVNSDTARNKVIDWYRSTLVSRLNDKASGAIIAVMQRLHQYDLCGMLLETGGYHRLTLPAIATEDELIPLTRGRVHHRKLGDVLHPERESREELEEMRRVMGHSGYSAQYQQEPVPAEGNIFRASWLKTFASTFVPADGGEIIQSWDTGNKTGNNNSWSVCVTAVMRGKHIYIVDVWRGRLEFPDLKRKVIELAQLHRAETLLIEDKASGQGLIQSLRAETNPGVPDPIARTPESDKISRAEGISSMFENGQVQLPGEAHWLGEFKSELLAFPSVKHDDQVDAVSQLLVYVRQRFQVPVIENAGPILIWEDDDGRIMASDDDDYDFGDIDPNDPWGA